MHPARRNKKKRNNKNNNNNNDINKSLDVILPKNRRMRKRPAATNAIYATRKWTEGLKPYELRFPTNIEVFHEMYSRDEAVGGVLNATYALVENAFKKFHIKNNNSSKDSIAAAAIVRHSLDNMRDMTVRSFARNAATFNQFGFSVIEKNYRKPQSDKEYLGPLPEGVAHEDLWFIDKLSMIPQRSLDISEPFIIGNEGRDIIGLRQNASWFLNSTHALRNWEPPARTINIARNKFMLMGINSTDSNPMGTSPLEQVWESWKQKQFYQRYLSVGISKDMAGMPLLEIPKDILDRANTDPNSPEAMLVTQMCEDVAAMHAGEQNMMIMPSDPFTDNGQGKEYNLKFVGIDGSGKNFDLQNAIDKCRESIYQSFGALNLISNESKGGYNQLEGQNAIHLYFVNRIINIIEESVNKDLIPQLLNLCGIRLSHKDMPRFKAGDIEPISLEEVSKMVQRVKSVNAFLGTKEVWIETYEKLGYDTEHLQELSEEELQALSEMGSKGESRSGEGMGTSGTGNSQIASGGDNNLDNSA